MNDILTLTNLRFPGGEATLVDLLNKYRFRGREDWTYAPGSYLVFSPGQSGVRTYYGDFMSRLLSQYLKCLEYLNRLMEQGSETSEISPHLSVLPDYHFYLTPGDYLPDDDFAHRSVIPAHMIRHLQAQLQH